MTLKNKSMYAILGILNLSPSTGYDIKMYSDRVLSGFWNENFGHIYPTLKAMLESGMIEIIDRQSGKQKIKYGITEKGRRELAVWLQATTEQQPVRSEFMLKLLFSSEQPTESVEAMLGQYRALHERNMAEYAEIQKELAKGVPGITENRARFLGAIVRNGVMASETAIRWCDETAKALIH